MFDDNLMFRTTGDLTQDESCGPITIYGTPIRGMSVRIEVPEAYGLNDTVGAKLHASQDGTNYNLIAQYAGSGSALAAYGGGTMTVPFSLPKGKKTYLKLELDVAAKSTTSDFGAVVAGLVLGRGAEVDRSVGWDL